MTGKNMKRCDLSEKVRRGECALTSVTSYTHTRYISYNLDIEIVGGFSKVVDL